MEQAKPLRPLDSWNDETDAWIASWLDIATGGTGVWYHTAPLSDTGDNDAVTRDS